MIGPLKTLFDLQRRRAEEDAEFVSRLDPSRTVLLGDLLADVRRPELLARLDAPWLDAGRLASRVAAACAWFEGVTLAEGVQSWDGLPLMFFQAGSAEEDAGEHMRRCGDAMSFYRERFGHLPPAVHYLHVHTNVFDSLDGEWGSGYMKMRPMTGTYSSYRRPFAYDGKFVPKALNGYVIGYRVTDLPSILGVGTEVASDFFARIVVHDLGHAFLPRTPMKAEGFHNVAMLDAMGTLPPIRYRDRWEGFVHAECTDPSFCLRARDEIAGMRKALGIPSMVEECLLAGYGKWYANAEAERKRRELWGLPRRAQAVDLLDAIETARADGFRINIRHMDPP
jgi:hypothetical protein